MSPLTRSAQPMIPSRQRLVLIGAGMILTLAALPARSAPFEYPTVDRVEFVESCINEHSDRPHQEMLYKCSCLIDQFAKKYSYDEYVDMTTAAKAFTIAGERGGFVRESNMGKRLNKQYKEVSAAANEACFIQAPAP